jgi:SNF2 family DNA or RNA helicase
MMCKVCNTEQEQIDFSKFLSIVTLKCNHSFSLTDEDKAKEARKIIFADGREPFPYQYTGIDFVLNSLVNLKQDEFGYWKLDNESPELSGIRALIADDMGVGKTLQAIGVLFRNHKVMTPCLFLVKSALKMQFFKEIFNALGPKFTPQIIESADTPLVPGIFKVHIATYDIIRRFSTTKVEMQKTAWGTESPKEITTNPFYEFPFESVIMDEVQAIKNTASKRSQEIARICKGKKHIIGLSGTPIKNHAGEYGSILSILRPDIFRDAETFKRRWVSQEGKLLDPARFDQVTKSFIIRRTRQEVMPDLPKINRLFRYVDFDDIKLKKQYQSLEDDIVNDLEKQVSKKEVSETIIGRIAQARHMVGIIKINPILEDLYDFTQQTERKTILALHHADVTQTVFLKYNIWALDNGYPEALLYHSSLSSSERYDTIQKFRNDKNRLLVGSTLAMGEGVDGLQHVCSDVIIGERQWNPANEEQFEARIERYGQTASQLNSQYPILVGTIDEYFTQIIETKRANMKRVMDKEITNWQESSLMQELFGVLSNKKRKSLVRGF